MDREYRSGLSDTKSSDTIIELSTVDGNRTSQTVTSEQNPDDKENELSEDGKLEKKAKPPPLDFSAPATQDMQNITEAIPGQKTPTSAPPLENAMLDRRRKEKKIGHRRVNDEGQITFKKIETTQIMGSIQLGIGHAIGSLASKPERDLLMQDFTIVESISFPRDGSNITAAHHYQDFTFKSYAPVAFRYFRDLFGIQPDDFLLSICNYPLVELTNPGSSGSVFYLTNDDEFIIKTVQHKEAEFLQKLLPGYYMNLNQNPRTLLPKFYGLYCYQCTKKKVRLAVMNNLLPSSIRLHEKYDLKGSTYKRKASKSERQKSSPTYKDLDFMEHHVEGITVEPDNHAALIRTLSRDCRVLESFRIMDYSLLLAIHNIDQAKKEKLEERKKAEESNGNITLDTSSPPTETGLARSKSINRTRLAAFSTAMESIQAEMEPPDRDEIEDDVPPGGIPGKNSKGENLLIFMGIIDVLQHYRLTKKLEHSFKSILHDGDTVSVHRPSFYAERFMQFMTNKVFKKKDYSLKHSPSKRKASAKKTSLPPDRDPDVQRLSKIPSESECPQEGVPKESIPSVPFPSYEMETSSVSDDMKSNTSYSSSTRGREKAARANMDTAKANSLRSSTSNVGKTSSVTWDKTEVVSLSQVTIQTESMDGISSSSSTSGLGSTLHTATWTPPHSVEGSTPTHTEGTPSFTESSSSGEIATPVRSIDKSIDSLPPLGETRILQGSEMIIKY